MRKVSLIIATALVGLTFASTSHSTPVATISIPALHMKSQRVFLIADEHYLAMGPAWWPQSGRPGQGKTVAIAGHDVTPVPGYGAHGPFHFLFALHKGNLIYVTWGGKTYRYRITTIKENPATNLHLTDDLGHERLVLTTCWPPGSASHRLTVYALPV